MQSRTQFQCCYNFSRSASKAASPTFGDVKVLNKLARQLKSQPLKLQFWPLTEPLRINGFLDDPHRKNEDGSSQRGMTVFLAESSELSSKEGMSYGSPIDYESQRIRRTVLSTTVAGLYSFMKCCGSCQFLRELWMDISGDVANIHMRTDAKNVVTTARTIHLPEQKETIHMISMLRRKARSGSIHDVAHIPTQNCLADCRTTASAKEDNLITAVKTVEFLEVDIHPNFRTLMEQNTFLSTWCRTFRHKGEGRLFLKCFEGISRTNSTRRTFPRDVCVKTTYSRTKTKGVRLEPLVVKRYCAS